MLDAVGAATTSTTQSRMAAPTRTARNVLLITADQWRADCLSSRGHPCVQTPHLDALARDGVAFLRHYCQAVPCGPSRASLHTGLYLMNHRSGTNGTPLDRRHENWAQIVRGAGYDPVLFGYTDTSPDPRDYPADHPVLTTYEGVLPGSARRNAAHGRHQRMGAMAARTRRDDTAATLRSVLPESRPDRVRERRAEPGAAAVAEPPARHVLHDRPRDRIRDRPARAVVRALSLLRPHPPWIAPAPYHARYAPDALPGFVRAESVEVEGEQHPWLAYPAVRQELSRAGVREEAAPAQGLVLRFDERGRRQPRPVVRTSEVDRSVRRYADRVHVGPRRAVR